MRISDWSSDVCSSDPQAGRVQERRLRAAQAPRREGCRAPPRKARRAPVQAQPEAGRLYRRAGRRAVQARSLSLLIRSGRPASSGRPAAVAAAQRCNEIKNMPLQRSEEHTSELQSLMRISYAVFCLKKKKQKSKIHSTIHDEKR